MSIRVTIFAFGLAAAGSCRAPAFTVVLDPANPEHEEILALRRASRYGETKIEDHAGIERAARAAGLLK